MGVESARISHRGLLLVAAVSESWGVLPTSDGGKVVWAVLAANPRSTRTLRPGERPSGGRSPAAAPEQTWRGTVTAGQEGLSRSVGDAMAAPTRSQLVRVLATAEWMHSGAPPSDLLSTAGTSASTTVSA